MRLHAQREAGEAIESPQAYLSTVVTRLAIDELRSARARRETYVGEWLPEPIVADPSHRPGRAGRARRLALAGLPGRAREPHPGAAGRVPAARGLRLPLRPHRRNRRAQRGRVTPARGAGPAAGGRGRAAVRDHARAAGAARDRVLRRDRATATSSRSSACSRPTSSCTATAAATRRRMARPISGRTRAARTLVAWSKVMQRVGGIEIHRGESSTDSRGRPCQAAGRAVDQRDGARVRRRSRCAPCARS